MDTWPTGEDRQQVNARWHRGHPEKRMKEQDFSHYDKLNVWADMLAEAAHRGNTPTVKPWELNSTVQYRVTYDSETVLE